MAAIFQAVMAIATGLCRHVLVFRSVAQAQARLVSRDCDVAAAAAAAASTATMPGPCRSTRCRQRTCGRCMPRPISTNMATAPSNSAGSRSTAGATPRTIPTRSIASRSRIDDYLASRMISTPLRLYDCDTHIDGSTAFILSHTRRGAGPAQPAAPHRGDGHVARRARRRHLPGRFHLPAAERAGDDAVVAHRPQAQGRRLSRQIYDGFSIHVVLWLEALQLVRPGRGVAASSMAATRIALDGELPLNTGGGQLSAGRFHGFGHTHEACVQLWGRGGERQVRDRSDLHRRQRRLWLRRAVAAARLTAGGAEFGRLTCIQNCDK